MRTDALYNEPMRHMWLTLFLLAVPSACFAANTLPATALPDNENIIRQASGVLAFRSLSTGATRGEERFHIAVLVDGTRMVSAVSRYGPRDIYRQSLTRLDAAMRPLDSTLHYWIEGEWRASGVIMVDGDRVDVTSRGPLGTRSHTVSIPGPFAVLPHQLTPDSMRVLLYDKTLGGTQTLTVYDPDPLAEGPDGLLGRVTTHDVVFHGPTTVTVPAGTFDVDHFTVGNYTDLFVTGPDAVLVKWSFPRIDREHVLMELETVGGSP